MLRCVQYRKSEVSKQNGFYQQLVTYALPVEVQNLYSMYFGVFIFLSNNIYLGYFFFSYGQVIRTFEVIDLIRLENLLKYMKKIKCEILVLIIMRKFTSEGVSKKRQKNDLNDGICRWKFILIVFKSSPSLKCHFSKNLFIAMTKLLDSKI